MVPGKWLEKMPPLLCVMDLQAKKLILVSVCWSHENRTSCHLAIQEMLPGNMVTAADGLALESLVARDRKL